MVLNWALQQQSQFKWRLSSSVPMKSALLGQGSLQRSMHCKRLLSWLPSAPKTAHRKPLQKETGSSIACQCRTRTRTKLTRIHGQASNIRDRIGGKIYIFVNDFALRFSFCAHDFSLWNPE